MSDKIMAYRRDNGRVGVRNHVLILPVDDISNAACEAVANNIKGTMAIPHAYGRLQFGEDLDVHFRTMIGTGANPNVAAVVVIGIEPGWTDKIADGIAETGKASCALFHRTEWRSGNDPCGLMESQGIRPLSLPSYSVGNATCRNCGFPPNAENPTRRPASAPARRLATCTTSSSRRASTGCFGETSEITGAEHICKERAINEEVGERWYAMWKAYQDDVIFAHQTDDLSDSQPTKGNIEGGLTTIEEKALGNLEKIGRECRYIDILEPAEAAGAEARASISWIRHPLPLNA